MTPQEKAEELVDKYYNILPFDKYVITKDEDLSWEYNDWEEAKKCALIAVDEIINNWINNFKKLKEDETIEIKHSLNEMMALSHSMKYWKEVKQEIEKQ